ncbi:potassium channel subfamily K member 2-like [Brevipalpus obovatus]|uniref:potassium channel subfamily K member 2-like n=1 Tax=Brevipalpus obovatus TaxID=246614 RepID=UPI003D9EBF74
MDKNLLAFIVYVFTGALVFMFLESESNILDQNERETLYEIRVRVEKMKLSGQEKQIQKNIIQTIDERIQELPQAYMTKWGQFNSIFFAITVVTTVGYGKLYPSTTWGKVFCIFFALFGIPLGGLVISLVDNFVRHVLRAGKMDWHFTFFIIFLPWVVIFVALPSIIFVLFEHWTPIEAIYYSFTTLCTVGLGDLVCGQYNMGLADGLYKLGAILWMIFGIALFSVFLKYIDELYIYILGQAPLVKHKKEKRKLRPAMEQVTKEKPADKSLVPLVFGSVDN